MKSIIVAGFFILLSSCVTTKEDPIMVHFFNCGVSIYEAIYRIQPRVLHSYRYKECENGQRRYILESKDPNYGR